MAQLHQLGAIKQAAFNYQSLSFPIYKTHAGISLSERPLSALLFFTLG